MVFTLHRAYGFIDEVRLSISSSRVLPNSFFLLFRSRQANALVVGVGLIGFATLRRRLC